MTSLAASVGVTDAEVAVLAGIRAQPGKSETRDKTDHVQVCRV